VTKPGNRDLLRVLQPVAAVVLVSVLAAYLFQPHWFQLGIGPKKILLPLNAILAAMGGYVVTRRWISSFDASLLAGVIYGFGALGLSFIKYHFTAGCATLLSPGFYARSVLSFRTFRRRRKDNNLIPADINALCGNRRLVLDCLTSLGRTAVSHAQIPDS
jgi:hypothetical protein